MQPPQPDAFHSMPEGPAPSQAATSASKPHPHPQAGAPYPHPQAGAPHPHPHAPYSAYPHHLQYPEHPSYPGYPAHSHPRSSFLSRMFGRIPPVYGPPPLPHAAAAPPPPPPHTPHPYSASYYRHYRRACRGPRLLPLLFWGGVGAYAYNKLAHRIEDVRDEVALGRQAERRRVALQEMGQEGLLSPETRERLGVVPTEGEGRKRWGWGCAHERKRERELMEQARREEVARRAAELELARTGEVKGEEGRML
ncbi:hypothetical protein JCM1840_006787 [Sporobolomyces johnsonii]